MAAGGAKAGSRDGQETGGTSSMFNCKPVAIPMEEAAEAEAVDSHVRHLPGGSGGGAGCNHAFPVQAGGSGGSFGNTGAHLSIPCFARSSEVDHKATSANGGNGKQISQQVQMEIMAVVVEQVHTHQAVPAQGAR